MTLNFLVLYGSVRSERTGIRAARYVVKRLEARGHTATLIDPLERPLPLLDRMYKQFEPGTAPENMEFIAEAIKACDAVVVVSGEYNHGIPPALKNLLDHYLEEWNFRPAGIVCYSAGPFGGVRAAMQLRMTLPELGLPTIPSLYPIPRVAKTFDEDGTPVDEDPDRRSAKFFDELDWYAEALADRRAKGVPY